MFGCLTIFKSYFAGWILHFATVSDSLNVWIVTVLLPVASSNDIAGVGHCAGSVALLLVASSNDIAGVWHCADSVVLLLVASSNNIAGVEPCAGSVGPSELSLLESPPLAFF